ncbi:hypothetical protein INT44_007603 [Umbelopsis vinacea]|uniref:Uncharacterized protein n=1 Tax=Umbelopsis vinacea TaxID=44442 RepID=A0A8H7PK06_9FUNG|nr:hypothetical protein INT44_007603 [Umbelopsis vinacea]
MESQFENDFNHQLRRVRMPMLYYGGRRLVMSVQRRVSADCPYTMVTGIRRGDAHRFNKGIADMVWSAGVYLSTHIFTRYEGEATYYVVAVQQAVQSYKKRYISGPDAKWFAYLRRQDLKDVVSIYDAESFEVIKNIELDTVDAQDIVISPNGGFIAAYDVPLLYKVSVYRPDGTKEASFSVDDGGLGIKSVCWSPDSQFLAVGGYDNKLRLLDTFTWKPVSIFTHQTKYLDNPEQEILIEREVMSGAPHAGYDIRNGIQHIPRLRPDHDRPNPKTSVTAKFNNLGNLMLTTSETIPTTACIWNMATMKSHAIIVQQEPILTALWNPKISSLLAICCEGGRFYLWQDRRHGNHRSNVTAINIPAEKFSISNIRWSPDGKTLLLMSKDMFCLAWPIDS